MAATKTNKKRKTIHFNFGEEHKEYIRQCRFNTFNILEGAVRSGKTVDNVFAFAHDLKTAPDRIHLATGSTIANVKLNIGDANGFGLEYIFRGQCRWGKYKDNEALFIKGPSTQNQLRIVIFAGGAKADSYKKIRGNSYGMWIATEINLHHDNTIKEAFNRQLAAKKRKIYWDLNPEHPKAPIYVKYLDVYQKKAAEGTLLGGYNYRHFNIFQNINIPKERLDEIISQYEPGSIWYIRDIDGKRSIAEGLIYVRLATAIAANADTFLMPKAEVQKLLKKGEITEITIGVDFGGNGSGHAFVATAKTVRYGSLIVLKSRRYVEGEPDPDNPNRKLYDIDPDMLASLFLCFVQSIITDYGFVSKVYADSAEQVLMRGLHTKLKSNGLGNIRVVNALKSKITGRIFAAIMLAAQTRLFYTEDCESWKEAISMAVWNPKSLEMERLDDGSSDIDTLDAFEYTYERDIKKYTRG